MSKNKVGKERKGKGREGKEEYRLAFSPIRGGKSGWAIITKFGTRVKVGYVMTCAIFGVDISRDIDSGGGQKLGFPIYFVYGPYNLSLIHISEPTRRTPISYAVFCLKKKKTK